MEGKFNEHILYTFLQSNHYSRIVKALCGQAYASRAIFFLDLLQWSKTVKEGWPMLQSRQAYACLKATEAIQS